MTSGLLPAVPVSVWRQRVFRNKLGLFRRFLVLGQRFLVMFLGDEHVKRGNDEESKERSDRHAANQYKTDGISRGRTGTGYEREREVTGHSGNTCHHDGAQANSGGFR